MGLNRSKQLDNGWINRKWLDMVLIQSRRLDNLEKWLDKPKTVGFGCESIEMVGYLWKNGWINRKRWDISLIQSERWDILKAVG